MERFAFTDANGNALYIASPAIDGVYTDGQVINGQTARLLPENTLDNLTLINTYYFKDGWKVRAPRPGQYYNWNNVSEQWVADLEKARTTKNSIINLALITANQSGFTYGNSRIASDPLSRSHIDAVNGYVSVFNKLPKGWLGTWKTEAGTELSIPNAVAWKQLYGAMVNQIQANFVKAEQLKDTVAAATTIEEIEAVSW